MNKEAITTILAYGNSLMPEVRDLLNESAKEPGRLGASAAHHFQAAGKSFRGRLALSLGVGMGLSKEICVPLAAVCELLHNASLVHDDLQDLDETRRGLPAVWQKFGAETAVLLGDHMIIRAFSLLAQIPVSAEISVQLTQLFSARALEVVRGQGLDIDAHGDFKLSGEEYREIALAKTGALIALPAEAVLIAAGRPARELGMTQNALAQIGLAYQLRDDLEEFVDPATADDDAESINKVRVNAVTVEALARMPKEDRAVFERQLRQAGLSEGAIPLQPLIAEISKTGAAAHIFRKMEEACGIAEEICAELGYPLSELVAVWKRELCVESLRERAAAIGGTRQPSVELAH